LRTALDTEGWRRVYALTLGLPPDAALWRAQQAKQKSTATSIDSFIARNAEHRK
jgi:hypothetical protein